MFCLICQCFLALEFAFDPELIRTPDMMNLLRAAITDMEYHIKEALACVGKPDQEELREKLSLETIPFRMAKRNAIFKRGKEDTVRHTFQAMFLFLLRPKITLKCKLH